MNPSTFLSSKIRFLEKPPLRPFHQKSIQCRTMPGISAGIPSTQSTVFSTHIAVGWGGALPYEPGCRASFTRLFRVDRASRNTQELIHRASADQCCEDKNNAEYQQNNSKRTGYGATKIKPREGRGGQQPDDPVYVSDIFKHSR